MYAIIPCSSQGSALCRSFDLLVGWSSTARGLPCYCMRLGSLFGLSFTAKLGLGGEPVGEPVGSLRYHTPYVLLAGCPIKSP